MCDHLPDNCPCCCSFLSRSLEQLNVSLISLVFYRPLRETTSSLQLLPHWKCLRLKLLNKHSMINASQQSLSSTPVTALCIRQLQTCRAEKTSLSLLRDLHPLSAESVPARGYAFDPLSRRLVTVNSMCHLLPVGECQRANAPACSCRSLWISAQIKSSLHSAAVWFYQRKIRRSLLQSAVILSLSLCISVMFPGFL